MNAFYVRFDRVKHATYCKHLLKNLDISCLVLPGLFELFTSAKTSVKVVNSVHNPVFMGTGFRVRSMSSSRADQKGEGRDVWMALYHN